MAIANGERIANASFGNARRHLVSAETNHGHFHAVIQANDILHFACSPWFILSSINNFICFSLAVKLPKLFGNGLGGKMVIGADTPRNLYRSDIDAFPFNDGASACTIARSAALSMDRGR